MIINDQDKYIHLKLVGYDADWSQADAEDWYINKSSFDKEEVLADVSNQIDKIIREMTEKGLIIDDD